LSGGNFANHDGWYDDVSDGLVTASVKLNDGSIPAVSSAWAIVGPPKYAPGLQSVVSLYDTLYQTAIDRGLAPDPFSDPSFKPSFNADILPILLRAANMRWVYDNGTGQFASTGFHHSFNQLPPADRTVISTGSVRLPISRAIQALALVICPRCGPIYTQTVPNGTLTQTQYKMLRMWKDGNFVPATVVDGLISPTGLTRAALEPCVGAAFYPGIEASWKLRDVYTFVEPFRLDSSKASPGDISSQMSLPWQSDFLDCSVEPGNFGDDLVWWPAQRPIAVLSAAGGNAYAPWGRATVAGSTEMTVEQMITDWYKLGFVMAQPNGRFEEVDRL